MLARSATWLMFSRARDATVDGLEPFDDLLARWIEAEAGGDAAALDALLDGEFRGDGPRGYVLTKEQWLDRYSSGDLVNQELGWEETKVRVYDDTAVVMGVLTQTARYQDEDWSGRFRGTLVAVRRDGRWSIVNVQLSRT